jgi:hypothetical protein
MTYLPVPLAHAVMGALSLLVTAVDLAALGLGSMTLAVSLTLDNFVASGKPTETFLLGRNVTSGCHDFVDDILNLFCFVIVFFVRILFGRCHLGGKELGAVVLRGRGAVCLDRWQQRGLLGAWRCEGAFFARMMRNRDGPRPVV